MRFLAFAFVALLAVVITKAARAQLSVQRPTRAANAQPSPIAVKVVVVTMFQSGMDKHGTIAPNSPGELHLWVERDHLDKVYEVPAAFAPVFMNDQGEMAIVTGQGTAHAAASIMAIALDPRFDFSHAYWLIAGIAGGSPETTSLGTAAWAHWVVDGDLAYEIDAREIPKDWKTGFVPLQKVKPYEEPVVALPGQLFELNPELQKWAYELTREHPVADNEQIRAARENFDGAMARKPPFVTMGDELSAATFWHGHLFDQWANDWMRYYTDGKATFATTAMEDAGTLHSLDLLAKTGKVDWSRILVLRTVSNYDQPPRGMTPAESLTVQRSGKTGAFKTAAEAAYVVGHPVVAELLKR